jgi:hypothetical protein
MRRHMKEHGGSANMQNPGNRSEVFQCCAAMSLNTVTD